MVRATDITNGRELKAIRIVALHKLPWDPKRFAENAAEYGDDMADQLRECWQNAWLVVVEASCSDGEVDFDKFAHPERGSNAQVPWLEQILDQGASGTRVAFFLHYVKLKKPLWYGDMQLSFPPATAAPADLVDKMRYSSPD